jgi:hypothetical protein
MVLVVTDDGRSSLIVREIAGPDQTVLASVPGLAFFAVSPDGKRVAAMQGAAQARFPDGKLSFYSTTPRGEQTAVSLEENNVVAFFWSPDSRHVAYLTPPTLEDGQLLLEPFFAPDHPLYLQLRVADARNGESWAITTFPVSQAFVTNVLPFFDQFQRSANIWSPNSRYLTYSAMTSAGFPGVFVSSASGHFTPEFVAAGDLAFWSRR